MDFKWLLKDFGWLLMAFDGFWMDFGGFWRILDGFAAGGQKIVIAATYIFRLWQTIPEIIHGKNPEMFHKLYRKEDRKIR